MSATTPLPPGWYPDPSGKARKLYWDGQEWHTAPPPVPPSAQKKKPGCLRGLVLFLVLFAVLWFLLATCGHSSDTSSTTTPTTYSEQETESEVIRICQKDVKKDLKDPDSARFGDDWKAWLVTHPPSEPPKVTYHPENGDKLYSASGSVNAKNGFGGYVGDQPYGCDAAVTTGGQVHSIAYSLQELLNPTATP
ncbi:DUF2510 domain-containing protein [Mycobacterium sp.]|uniref:DUF2510 domain-containing protein n=1 Tax=Mycobacterium sp. TaxID=1785 RepID=UPI003F9959EE